MSTLELGLGLHEIMSQSTRGFSISEVKLKKMNCPGLVFGKKLKENSSDVLRKKIALLGTTGIEPGLFCGHKKT